MTDRPLTTKQATYLEGILQGLSGVKACMKAGYSGNSNTLAQRAHELVSNSKVKEAIEVRKAEIKAKTEYGLSNWRKNMITARDDAATAKQWSAVAAFDRLIGQHLGGFELDNKQKTEQIQLNTKKAEQARLIAVQLTINSLTVSGDK